MKKIWESPKILTKAAYYHQGLEAAERALANMTGDEICAVCYLNEGWLVVYKLDGNDYEGLDLFTIEINTEIDEVIRNLQDKYVEWLEYQIFTED